MINTFTAGYYTGLAALPIPGGTALPGTADAKFGTLMGWALGIVGIVAVLALIGAGIAFMTAKQNGQSTDGPEKALKIIAGVILATSATAVVTAVL